MSDPHKPERGHVAPDAKQPARIEAVGNPAAVDYARREGPCAVTYWSAPLRTGQGTAARLYLDLTECVATWGRA